ncbi:unnamed protein product, partial [Linum tenue]
PRRRFPLPRPGRRWPENPIRCRQGSSDGNSSLRPALLDVGRELFHCVGATHSWDSGGTGAAELEQSLDWAAYWPILADERDSFHRGVGVHVVAAGVHSVSGQEWKQGLVGGEPLFFIPSSRYLSTVGRQEHLLGCTNSLVRGLELVLGGCWLSHTFAVLDLQLLSLKPSHFYPIVVGSDESWASRWIGLPTPASVAYPSVRLVFYRQALDNLTPADVCWTPFHQQPHQGCLHRSAIDRGC